ncbi:MAG: universal stress protein, partial [Myxococcota bacterium]
MIADVQHHILIPFDGSEPSHRAVEHVARHAEAAAVTLFHVGPIPPELVEHPGAEDPRQEAVLEHQAGVRSRDHQGRIAAEVESKVLAAPKRRLEEAGMAVDTKVITSPHPDPARAIMAELEAGGYDGVVIGHHKHS